LARPIESSQLMATQGQVAVAPLDLGTRALEHGSSPLGFALEVGLSLRAQRAQDATGFKQRDAKLLGELAERCTTADVSSLGDASEIIRWDKLGMHGEGDERRHSELSDLLPDITRDKLDGRLPFRHDALSFFDAFQAAWAEPFLLGNRTNLLDVSLNICGDEWAVAAYSTLQIDKGVGVAAAPDTRLDLCALLSEPLVLTAGRFERLLGVLQAPRCFYGYFWTVPFGLVTRALRVTLPPCTLLCGFADGLIGGPLFGGHGTRDCFDELMLHMEQVG